MYELIPLQSQVKKKDTKSRAWKKKRVLKTQKNEQQTQRNGNATTLNNEYKLTKNYNSDLTLDMA
jgi:hypothetical protein